MEEAIHTTTGYTQKIGRSISLCISKHMFSLMYIEVDISKGLFQFNIAGLPDKTIKESRFRIVSALKNSHFYTPTKNNEKVTISLFPLAIHKKPVYTDLALVFAYLKASGQILLSSSISSKDICCIGNIALGGDIQVDQKDISHLIYQGYLLGIRYFIVPKHSNIHLKKQLFKDALFICTVHTLSDFSHDIVFEILTYSTPNTLLPESGQSCKTFTLDNLDGLYQQKRALQVALAGDHPILFVGPPGSGKSALAQAAVELMDELTIEEQLQLRCMHHISDTDIHAISVYTKRPVEIPHFKITPYQLIGNAVHPTGTIQRTYHGLLILDELAEYHRESIEVLRHRLDTSMNNYSGSIIATSNLCPCGKQSGVLKKVSASSTHIQKNTCICTSSQIKRYLSKISEPILDRFHILSHIEYVDTISKHTRHRAHSSGADIARSICTSRNIQRTRNNARYNARLSSSEIKHYGITQEAIDTFNTLLKTFALSKRKTEHIYRLARTIADLESKQKIEPHHVYEASNYVKQELC